MISSGIYGYPREDAMRVAMGAINEYLMDVSDGRVPGAVYIYSESGGSCR